MTGKNRGGDLIDPCTWVYGSVIGVPCSDVNPIFHFSGDPVSSIGWIQISPCYMRMYTNIGPFVLPANERVDIWTAYIVGRGNNNLKLSYKIERIH